MAESRVQEQREECGTGKTDLLFPQRRLQPEVPAKQIYVTWVYGSDSSLFSSLSALSLPRQHYQDKHFLPFKSHRFISKPVTCFFSFKGMLLRN